MKILTRPSAETLPINLSDLYALLVNVTKGASDPMVGCHDINNSLYQIKKHLDRTIHVPLTVIESALWSANLLNEKDEFEHPDGITFGEFVKRISQDKYTFDYFFNLLEEKKNV